ncbi:MAG: TIGR03936 family radical SAM-associated protein [Oscillospiraceae bacterium]
MINVRLHFSKIFNTRYISHLDLMRTITRAVKQSGVSAWFTEGYNTHLYLTFSLPLSLGFESICETCDIRILDDEFDQSIAQKINAFLPWGIEIFNCNIAKYKTGDIGFARYLIEFDDIELSGELIEHKIRELIESSEITALKKTKKGTMRTIDLKPMIHSAETKLENKKCYLDMVVCAENDNSFNPMLLLNLLFESLGREPDHYLVKRTQILTKEMMNFE